MTKYTYEYTYKEAKKYKTRMDFHNNCRRGYEAAHKNNWIKDYTWFKPVNTKPLHYWQDYKNCYNEAKKYKSKMEFHSNCIRGYTVACKNNWMKDYTWFLTYKRAPLRWTYEKCKQEALKYQWVQDFFKGSRNAYNAMHRNNWLKDFKWLKYKQKPDGYWDNYDNCKQEALKYKSKVELKNKNRTVYVSACKHGWIKDYNWFENKQIDIVYGKIYSIYKYVFNYQDKFYVYVGLSLNIKKRTKQHLNGNSKVYDFSIKYNIPIPAPEIIESNLTQSEARIKEDYYVNFYKNKENYVVLNNGHTGKNIGSVGGMHRKWTRERCYKEALKYKYAIDFKTNCNGAYQMSHRNRWFKDYTWLEYRKNFYFKKNSNKT